MACFCKLGDMNANVIQVDLVRGGVVINFGDGIAAFFEAEFLYAHGSDGGNGLLPNEKFEN